jgi:hypothetical protein
MTRIDPNLTPIQQHQEIRLAALEMAVRVAIPGTPATVVMERAHWYAHYIAGTPASHHTRCAFRDSTEVADMTVSLEK